MATQINNDKIVISIDDQVIELTGADKEVFLSQRAKDLAEFAVRQGELQAKLDAKAALLDRLGITADEAKLLLS